jgi:outer membrane protein
MVETRSGIPDGRGSIVPADWRFAVAALAALGALVPGVAVAADLPVPPAPPPTAPAAYAPAAPDWIVTVGLEGRVVPSWPGAPDSKLIPSGFPLFSIRKQGTPPDFFGPRDSFGFSILDFGQFKFGPAIKIAGERKAWSDSNLYGLSGVHYALQAGGFAEYWPISWLRLRGEVRQGFGGETGVTGDLFLDAVVPAGQFRFSAGPRMTVQSAAAVSPYFSITTAESAATAVFGPPRGLAPLPAYSAGGGLYSYGAGGQVEYFFSPQWSAHGFTEYERLTGSVADSPLVTQRGSPDQLTFGLGATYSFAMSPRW